MAAAHPALASPAPPPVNPQPVFNCSNGDFSSLDFLSLIGMDGPTPQAESASSPKIVHPPPPHAEAALSYVSVPSSGSSASPRRGSVHRTANARGRPRTRGTRRPRAGSNSSPQDQCMEADYPIQVQIPRGMSQNGGADTDVVETGIYGLQGGEGGEGFDAVQAGLLQQQLEHMQMHSPIVYNPSNPYSPYQPIAQMYLTYPQGPHSHSPQQNQHGTIHMQRQVNGAGDNSGDHRKWLGPEGMGILTPAPSGDMFPQMRTDVMSPMQLEMLARGEGLEGQPDFNVIPLLSPALSHQAGGSTYASPAAHASYPAKSNFHPSPYAHYAHQTPQARSPIEQLQEQQRQFQEQLILLQQQQKQLQATAAAVAAASTSPYVPDSAPGSGHSRPVAATAVHGPRSAGSVSTPSPGCFSPLTSPALDASTRNAQHNQLHGFSPALGSQAQHGSQFLSALSSPALNPVGSSGGAQQTLSPALEPQSNPEIADPEYLRALVGFLDGQQQHKEGLAQTLYPSPVIPSTHHDPLSSPVNGASSGAGPHRNSLPAKSRPSPMMKPTHRSHGRQSSVSAIPGQFSMPSSPIAQKNHPFAFGMGYLPPAAIDHRGVQQHQQAMQRGPSTSSTPSPVDLSQIMPPPPVPSQNGASRGLIPMTPASLMNLGRAGGNGEVLKRQPAQTPKRQVAARKGAAVSQTIGIAKKAGNGAKVASTAGGKRALAIRPPGVGVRAATKAATAAAALIPPEGEMRRTSHKAAEQKRRDSLKAGFDELRLLLPPINTEALDPESGEPIPGSSAPRLLPKSSLVPDDNPNRGVSKVALLKFSNEYIERLHDKVDKRDGYIDQLRDEVRRLRVGGEEEVRGEDGEDLLDMDMLEGEEEDFGDPPDRDDEDEVEVCEEDGEGERNEDEGMEDMDEGELEDEVVGSRPKRAKRISQASGKGRGGRPEVGGTNHSSGMRTGRRCD